MKIVLLMLGVAAVAAFVLRSPRSSSSSPGSEGTKLAGPPAPGDSVATFAAGCFWCVEATFEKVDGVVNVLSGYTGGTMKHPTYEEVSSGKTGHCESVLVEYDPKKISYGQLLDVFWHNVDPTTPNRQFCDVGSQYRPEIFYHGEAQKEAAEASKKALEASGRFPEVAVKIAPAGDFWVAEDYHQDFYKKNPVRYKAYRLGCGRDRRLEKLWSKGEH